MNKYIQVLILLTSLFSTTCFANVETWLGRFAEIPAAPHFISKVDGQVHPINKFKAATWAIPIGLYREVMQRDPEFPISYGIDDIQEVKDAWDANPWLPVVFLLPEDRDLLLSELRKILARPGLDLPDDYELEYMQVGRKKKPDGSYGDIHETLYYFGDDPTEVENRAWINTNSSYQCHGVKDAFRGELEKHTNPFGQINFIGNVFKPSRDGWCRGGCFSADAESCAANFRRKIEGRSGLVGLWVIERIASD